MDFPTFLEILLGPPLLAAPFLLHTCLKARQDIRIYEQNCAAIRQAIIDKGVI